MNQLILIETNISNTYNLLILKTQMLLSLLQTTSVIN